ncbi:MAG: PAS domain-containing protein [Myxococcales bacterium]|nr:PAS domain-containing protein [Myxococcales bacterium]
MSHPLTDTLLHPLLRHLMDGITRAGLPLMLLDADGVVVDGNAALADRLGLDLDTARGRPCADVVQGRDVFGNVFCGPDCPVLAMWREGVCLHPYEIEAHGVGEPRKVTFVPIAVKLPDGEEPMLLQVVLDPTPAQRAAEADDPDPLTPREIEVLEGLARGLSTRGLVAALHISVSTVRNHLQSVFRKLGVHSRLEAVLVARARGLVGAIPPR